MSKLDRSRLLDFLQRPRVGREIADHFNVPVKVAHFHLREAIKSGQVLMSERPILKAFSKSNGKLDRSGEFVYVFRHSPVLSADAAKFRVKESHDSISRSKGDVPTIRFVSNTHGIFGKEESDPTLSGLTTEEASSVRTMMHHFKNTASPTSELDVSSAKVKAAKGRTVQPLMGYRRRLAQERAKFLPHEERIRLFQAVLREPLSFLDLHGRFGVSRQIMRGLVKNRFLTEVWGSRAIGVRFKLTDKGKTHLKELEAAARHEPIMREKTFIRLKHTITP